MFKVDSSAPVYSFCHTVEPLLSGHFGFKGCQYLRFAHISEYTQYTAAETRGNRLYLVCHNEPLSLYTFFLQNLGDHWKIHASLSSLCSSKCLQSRLWDAIYFSN